MSQVIAVFGSAKPRSGSAVYEESKLVGQLLAQAGYAVMTGGYTGTMEGVSEGAATAGGHVIGVTCTQINLLHDDSTVNPWVTEEVVYETLPDRLLHLIHHNAGMIVLPGGIGTLSELSLAWSLMQVGDIEPRPLIAVGPMWRGWLEDFAQPTYVSARDLPLVQFADTAEEAVAILQKMLGDAA